MSILDALIELYSKVVGSAPVSAGSIANMIHQLAVNWPEGGGAAVSIDTSLTKSGQAADAKATGDALGGKAATTHTHTASQITDLPAAPGNATASTAGLVKQAANVAAAAGESPTKAEFDGLLTALKNAGIMAADV